MLSLPLDILREIVDELVLLHDRGTLRALSQTCQVIRPSCLKHLFRSISIPRSTAGLEKAGRWRLSQRDRRDFCSLLERSPYLVACMKSIRFVMDEDDIKVSTKPSVDRMAIINILRKFDHVKEFTISWEGEKPNRLEWTTLTSGLAPLGGGHIQGKVRSRCVQKRPQKVAYVRSYVYRFRRFLSRAPIPHAYRLAVDTELRSKLST